MIGRLTIDNVRGLPRLELELGGRCAVLHGWNGSGKTTALECVALALHHQLPAERMLQDECVHRLMSMRSAGALVQFHAAGGVKWRKMMDGLPVLAAYAADTRWISGHQRGPRHDALSMGERIMPWAMDAADVVQLALTTFMDGWIDDAAAVGVHEIVSVNRRYYNRKRLEPEVKIGGTWKTVSHLPGGLRRAARIVTDIAARWHALHPGADTHDVQGVVMIDDIDAGLHPVMQREILPRLRATFPGVQFIVTTYSPQVLASAEHADEVFELVDQGVIAGGWPCVGLDANHVLSEVMHAAVRPARHQGMLDEMYRAIGEERLGEAKRILAELTALWGADEPALEQAVWLIEAEESCGDVS